MILVINSGSSSIKFKLFQAQKKQVVPVAEGIAERINIDGNLKIMYQGQKYAFTDHLPNHEVAMRLILDKLLELKAFNQLSDIVGVGFRIVHGGEIAQPVVITDQVYQEIQENTRLAPLHNPSALIGVEAIKKLLPGCPMVACFDTTFHQSIPEVNYLYAVPYDWYTKYAVRKYGFHGISYQYIVQKMRTILKQDKDSDQLNLIICHLGNGSSAVCVKEGKSFDTTMGLTPLAGLVMGTRSGDIDPGIIQYMSQQLPADVDGVTELLNKESGLKGLSGLSADMRDVIKGSELGDDRAHLALEKYTQVAADFIVKYANYLEGSIDGIVFTGGIGENSALVKKLIVEKANLLALKINPEANQAEYEDYLLISDSDSKYPVYKVRTDEETMICLDTIKLIQQPR